MSSLTKYFDNLNIEPLPKHSSHNESNKDPEPPMQLAIPQINTHGRSMYYGFETTGEWLIEYTKSEFKKRGYAPNPPRTDFQHLVDSRLLLQAHSGVRSIRVKSVFPQGATILPRPKDNRQIFPLQESGGTIVAICSSSPNWFAKRPSQAQVDMLKSIMGGQEPKWWVSDE